MKKHLLLVSTFCFLSAKILSQSYSIYGTTAQGGAYGLGVLYRYDYPSGKDTVLINFNGTNGATPGPYTLLANNWYLYAVTKQGGTYNVGVINRLNLITYSDTVLLNFNDTNGNITGGGGMGVASNGLFYGISEYGGTYNQGVFYSFNPLTNIQTVLFSFHDSLGTAPGQSPFQGKSGLIYGHTSTGGTNNDGVIYSYNINTSTYTVIKDFSTSEGILPRGIIQATNGLFYGCMKRGGTDNYGIGYSYNPVSNIFDTLFTFTGSNGIYDANGVMFQATDGLILSVTEMGGANNKGVMLAYDINTARDSALINFASSGIMGSSPIQSSFIQSPDGLIYLPVDSGGSYGMGVLLCYNLVTGKDSVVINFNVTNGAYPQGIIVNSNLTTGVNNISLTQGKVMVFPNPNNGKFTIQLSVPSGQSSVEVYNVLGEKVFSQFSIFNSQFSIDLSSQPNGIYFYRVITNDGGMIDDGKIIVQR